uniref:Uncharacterized protein n=1 Tax=Romanomermis culicivorax TaxID=13658 RepID=A0A915HUU9_ROMCU
MSVKTSLPVVAQVNPKAQYSNKEPEPQQIWESKNSGGKPNALPRVIIKVKLTKLLKLITSEKYV